MTEIINVDLDTLSFWQLNEVNRAVGWEYLTRYWYMLVPLLIIGAVGRYMLRDRF